MLSDDAENLNLVEASSQRVPVIIPYHTSNNNNNINTRSHPEEGGVDTVNRPNKFKPPGTPSRYLGARCCSNFSKLCSIGDAFCTELQATAIISTLRLFQTTAWIQWRERSAPTAAHHGLTACTVIGQSWVTCCVC